LRSAIEYAFEESTPFMASIMGHSILIAVIVCSYLLGSIPFGYILVRVIHGVDVREVGSGNIGATNVARSGGKWLAITTFLLDAFKGWLPVFVVLHRPGIAASVGMPLATLGTIAAVSAVAGHIFTFWLRFKGGKGVATGLGVFVALAPEAALLALAIFAVVVLTTRYVSLASILATAAFPLILCWLKRDSFPPAALGMAAAAALLVIWRHRQNIGRLFAGTENRVGARKA
jgi:glycerol-3-phosphate acyltransferase PlsY